jgi:hypothetical protein
MKVVNPDLVLLVVVVTNVLHVVLEIDPHVRDLVLPNLHLNLLNPPLPIVQSPLEKLLLNAQHLLHTNPILLDPNLLVIPQTQTLTIQTVT